MQPRWKGAGQLPSFPLPPWPECHPGPCVNMGHQGSHGWVEGGAPQTQRLWPPPWVSVGLASRLTAAPRLPPFSAALRPPRAPLTPLCFLRFILAVYQVTLCGPGFVT